MIFEVGYFLCIGSCIYPDRVCLTRQVEEVGKSIPGYEPETGSISKVGTFEFVSPEGQQFRIDYTAGEEGFVPSGAHLPVPPAQIPEYAAHRQQYPEVYG